MLKHSKEYMDLAAALKFLDNGYKLLTAAGLKENEADSIGMQKDLNRARVFFKMFTIAIQRVENLEKAVKEYSKANGIPVRFLYDKILNNVDINEKEEEGVR